MKKKTLEFLETHQSVAAALTKDCREGAVADEAGWTDTEGSR